MEALPDIKTNYLLEAGLDVLHAESKEWLNKLEFQKTELEFFLKFLKSKDLESQREKQRQHILENMDKLCTIVVMEVLNDTRSHERYLAGLLADNQGDDAHFRSAHKVLNMKVQQLENDVLTLKMLVFKLV